MEKNLTQGSIVKSLVLFSLPLILSGLLQQLYSWADAFIVGNVEGELQLAAIGATGSLSNLLVMLITGFTVGISILAAHMYGSGQRERLRDVLSSFTLVLTGVFLAAAALGCLFAPSILGLLQTPRDIFPISSLYLRIVLAGTPFLVIYNIYGAILRGMGDSRTPFLAIVVSALSNILLDVLLVSVFRFGAAGAAVATVLSQALMAAFIVVYATKKHPLLRFRPGKKAIDRDILARGLRLSIPTALQASVHSAGNLLLQNFMNSFGTQTVAAITTAYRVDSIIMLPINNLGAGISTITAQNMGAGNPKRAKKALGAGALLTAAISVVLTLVIIPSGGALISMFGVQAEAVAIGQAFFRIIAVFYLPYGVAMAIKGYLEGTGDVICSGILTIVSLAIRILLSYLFRAQLGNQIIAWAEAFAWVALLLMCFARLLYLQKARGRRGVKKPRVQ